MAIAFDTAVDGLSTTGTSHTWNHTCTGSLGLLIVGFNGANIGGGDDITSVTYNGVALTLADKQVNPSSGGDRNTYLYFLVGPATGSHTVQINCTSSHLLQGGSSSYTGVKASGQPDAHTVNAEVTSSLKTLTTSVTTSADNCWGVVVEGCYDGGTPPAAGTGSTRRTFDATNGGWGIFDSNSAIHPAGSYSMTTTRSSDPFGLEILHVMASFQPDTGAAAVLHFLGCLDAGA